MDLAKLLAYGDPYLSNTFYFVVQPLALFVMVSLPLVLPWVGARLAGRSGLAVVTLLAIAAIVAQSLW